MEVLTDQPLARVMRSPAASGRLVKWAMKLTQYGIEYKPRPSIKAQALADSIVECTATSPSGDQADGDDRSDWWTINVDGAASMQTEEEA